MPRSTKFTTEQIAGSVREWWRKGKPVANRAHPHPYQADVPAEYADRDRWFLLDTSLDPPRPWSLETPLEVFAIALVRGTAPIANG